MTEAEEIKLLTHLKTLRKMLDDKESEIYEYGNRYKNAASASFKFMYQLSLKQCKEEYEAIDYATELIKKELGEVAK